MERVIEKSGAMIGLPSPAGPALDALAVISVATALVGTILVAGGASWRVAAYVSILGVLFDLLFSYEFFIRLFRAEQPIPWLSGCSSILPLLLVSGPFLSGWILSDLGASAVRGLWLGTPPIASLAVIASLRILRLVRPFQRTSRANYGIKARHQKGLRTASLVGAAVVLIGAACAETLLIPGMAWSSEASRTVTMDALSRAASDSEAVAVAQSAGVLALRLDGRVLIRAPRGHAPGQYATRVLGGIEAWFSVTDENRVRATIAAIVLLASLASATGYAVIVFKPWQAKGSLLGHRSGIHHQRVRYGRDGRSSRSEPRPRPDDKPAGSEELAGILGKPHP